MKTIISHFYNEEYLLPYWLKHHRERFDHGIMINYNSTDSSVNIIKELCPSWEIVDSVNEYFDATECDKEVMKYESSITGFKIALNTTEFIIGNFSVLDDITNNIQFTIPTYLMIDEYPYESSILNPDIPLIHQRTFGIDELMSNVTDKRNCRSLHNFNLNYTQIGRHFYTHNTTDFRILWYGYSPFNELQIKRKLQINPRRSEHDVMASWGLTHSMTKNEHIRKYEYFKSISSDLSDKIHNINK